MIGLIAAGMLAAGAATPPPVSAVKPAPPATAITPMAERIVVLSALNKRNGQTQQFSAKPGETLSFATLTVRVRACETTPPWEARQTAAYLQINDVPVRVRAGSGPGPRRVFSGWMFAESPSLNPLEHPLYDVWVKSCTMRFPETGPETVVEGRSDASQSKAAKSPGAAKALSSKPL